jgi:subtilisin-like proprotein convertase family protein
MFRVLGRTWIFAAIFTIILASSPSAVRAAETADAAPTHWRLLTVPASPQASALFASSRVRVIARYGTFTLVEATGAEVKQLVALGGEVRDDMHRVRIGTHTFDPVVATPYLVAKTGQAPRLASKGGVGMAVVQYVGPLKQEWLKSVSATGVEFVSYMPQNAQLVIGDSGALAALSGLAASEGKSFVRAVVPYGAMFKLRPGIAQSGVTQVVVSTAAGKAGATARADIARLSTARGTLVPTAGTVQQRIQIDAGKISDLAELGGVVAIEAFVEPKLHDERSGVILSGQLDSNFKPVLGTGYRQYLINHGFPTVSPVIVDVTDEGVDKGVVPVPAGSHPAFYQNGNPNSPSRIIYAQEATAADSDARDCGGHGTNVAGIITGYYNNNNAKIGATKIFRCTTGTFDVTTSIAALHNSAYASGARISNNSWGAAVGGAYDTRSQEFDGIVRDAQPGAAGNQQFVEVVSAGNSGPGPNTIGTPGTAKNVITVGAAEGVRPIGGTDGCGVTDASSDSARDIVNFSSRGPTDDGRIKPDVVAPGTHITGEQPQTGADYNGSGTCIAKFPAGSPIYNLVSGTSQAAPAASGFASLIHTWFLKNHGNNTTYPSPAMTKALMINTATDLAGGDAGNGTLIGHIPSQDQGWGRINLGNLLDGTTRDLYDQKVVFGATGQATTRYYTVDDLTKPLRVTLVWSDAIGPTVGNASVNDLDLEVTAGGNVYKGNVFADGLSTTGGTADSKNNVENVYLPAGTRGTVKVRIIAKNIVGDGVPGNADTTDQDYALVVSNGKLAGTLGVMQMTGLTVNARGDSDGVIERGEPFEVRLRLKNVGNKAIAAFAATLVAPATEATVTQGSTNFPAIAPNASVVNNPIFSATVKSNLTCGKTVHLSARGTANGAPFVFPIEVPTGKPGAAGTLTSTDVPKAIPDNSPTGVTSVLNIPNLAIISKMEVKITQLTHTFDSDLIIDLTSPDGTTVVLFNARGTSGDNLTNTVFSDAAATPISAGAAPFTGSFIPEQPLSAFNGKSAKGDWKLRVRDRALDDTGTLSGWGLIRTFYICN